LLDSLLQEKLQIKILVFGIQSKSDK